MIMLRIKPVTLDGRIATSLTAASSAVTSRRVIDFSNNGSAKISMNANNQLDIKGGTTGSGPTPMLHFADYYDNSGDPSISHIELGFGTYGFGINANTTTYFSNRDHAFYSDGNESEPTLLINCDDDLVTINGDLTPTGNVDLGSADFELPQASAAAPDADGEVELDMTDGTLVIQNSSGHTYLGSSTDVVYGKLLKQKSITIMEPDKVQAVSDAIPMFAVETDEYPHGIEIAQVYLKTDANSTLSVNLESWTDPADASPSTLTTVATSTSDEVNEAPDTDGTVAGGKIVMLDLDTTDVNWVQVTIVYYEPIA